MKKSNKKYLVYGGLFLTSLLVVSGLYFFMNPPNQHASEALAESPVSEKSKMTDFDIQLARRLMDKDKDGRCDFCGMNVNLCIDSGMMECTMDPKTKIGILGSDHIHADFKVYLNGQKIGFDQETYLVKSAFAHVEREQRIEETGNVLHIHAKGVPLWLFFESLGMSFDSNCFKSDSKQFCNKGDSKLRFFVNGLENDQFANYIPKNLDRILITYGKEDEIKEQLNSITDYAKSKPK